MSKLLEEIPYPGHATKKSWAGYPPEALTHPGRNRPEAVRWLIERYTKNGDLVYDPMAGAGTMLREARLVSRFARGYDIDPCMRDLWPVGTDAYNLHNRSLPLADLIITSPPYPGTNHKSGSTAKQAEYDKQIGSAAGTEWPEIEGHIGHLRGYKFYDELRRLVNLWLRSLAVGGHLIIIVRNRIHFGEESSFVGDVKSLLSAKKCLVYVGKHPRKLARSARQEQREKLNPGAPWVDTEYALVYQRTM